MEYNNNELYFNSVDANNGFYHRKCFSTFQNQEYPKTFV